MNSDSSDGAGRSEPSVEPFRDERPSRWFVLVVGLPIGEDVFELGTGLVLRRLPTELSVFDLAAVGAVGFREWAVLEPLARGATAEIESHVEAAKTPGYDALNRVWLVSAMIFLRGFQRHLCPAMSAYSWSEIAGHVDQSGLRKGERSKRVEPKPNLPRFSGGLLDFHLRTFRFDRTGEVAFSAMDAQWVREHLDTFDRLAAEDRRFRFALEAAMDSRYAKDSRAAIARVWSAIESIFNVSSELVFRLSLMLATTLAPRGPERLALFERSKKLYGLRSKAVHGAEIEETRLTQGLVESWDLLRRLLLDAVQRGAVRTEADFNEAIFG